MSARNHDTYLFDNLISRHEDDTRALEQALASPGQPPSQRQLLLETVRFRRLPNRKKLEIALWKVASRLSRTGLYRLVDLGGADLDAIAAMLGTRLADRSWASPNGAGVDFGVGGHASTQHDEQQRHIGYCQRAVLAFGQAVVDARGREDLDAAAAYLFSAADVVGADLVLEALRPLPIVGDTLAGSADRILDV